MKKQIALVVHFIMVTMVLAAQNVGIGTNTPNEKLHVAGNVKADTLKSNSLKVTTNAGEGKLLTSDADGNASWRAPATSTSGASVNGTVGFGSWGDCSMNGISEYDPVSDTAVAFSDGLGNTVAISGNFAIVGMRTAGAGTPRKGYADIFQFDGVNWVFMQRVSDPNGVAGDFFGISVAISGNFAIVGSLTDPTLSNSSPRQGTAFVFHYDGNSWVLIQALTDPGGLANDNFGISVALSGNNAIIAAKSDDIGTQADQGSSCIFHYNGTSWGFVQKLFDANGAAGDNFGTSVSISDNFALIGASNDDVGANVNQGSVSIYQFNGSNWVFLVKLTDAAGIAGESFGSAVSISGNFAAAAAPSANSGATNDPGAVFVFRFNGATWALMQEVTHPSNGLSGSRFGESISIFGENLMVGSQFQGPGVKGLIIIYARIGLNWQVLQNVTDPQGIPNDGFGIAVSIDGSSSRFHIGVPGYASNSGKAIFGKY